MGDRFLSLRQSSLWHDPNRHCSMRLCHRHGSKILILTSFTIKVVEASHFRFLSANPIATSVRVKGIFQLVGRKNQALSLRENEAFSLSRTQVIAGQQRPQIVSSLLRR